MTRAWLLVCTCTIVAGCYEAPDVIGATPSDDTTTGSDIGGSSGGGEDDDSTSVVESSSDSTADPTSHGESTEGGCLPATFDDALWDDACFQ